MEHVEFGGKPKAVYAILMAFEFRRSAHLTVCFFQIST